MVNRSLVEFEKAKRKQRSLTQITLLFVIRNIRRRQRFERYDAINFSFNWHYRWTFLSLSRSRVSFYWTRNEEKEGKSGRQRREMLQGPSVFDLCVNYITRPNIGAPLRFSRRVKLFDFATCSCARNSLSYRNVWLASSRTMAATANPENGSKQMFLSGSGRWNELRRFTIFRGSWEFHGRQ